MILRMKDWGPWAKEVQALKVPLFICNAILGSYQQVSELQS